MNVEIDLFKHHQLQACLKEISETPALLGRKKCSLRVWANKLGYRSPRSVGMIFEGKRLPSPLMIQRLTEILKLSQEQKEYLFFLLLNEKMKKQGSAAQKFPEFLDKVNPRIPGNQRINEAQFSYISDWYHLVIKQLIKNEFSPFDLSQIERKLKSKVSKDEISRALKNLETIGLIEFDSTRKNIRRKISSISTSNDVPSQAIKNHHFGMMARAAEALKEEPTTSREFSSATFSFDPKYIPEVKDLIRNFCDRLEKKYANPEAKDVYQVNIQFFPHSDKKISL